MAHCGDFVFDDNSSLSDDCPTGDALCFQLNDEQSESPVEFGHVDVDVLLLKEVNKQVLLLALLEWDQELEVGLFVDLALVFEVLFLEVDGKQLHCDCFHVLRSQFQLHTFVAAVDFAVGWRECEFLLLLQFVQLLHCEELVEVGYLLLLSLGQQHLRLLLQQMSAGDIGCQTRDDILRVVIFEETDNCATDEIVLGDRGTVEVVQRLVVLLDHTVSAVLRLNFLTEAVVEVVVVD